MTSGFAYEVLDLIYLYGLTLTNTPLIHRKALLKDLVGSSTSSVVRYSEHSQGNDDACFKHASMESRVSFRLIYLGTEKGD